MLFYFWIILRTVDRTQMELIMLNFGVRQERILDSNIDRHYVNGMFYTPGTKQNSSRHRQSLNLLYFDTSTRYTKSVVDRLRGVKNCNLPRKFVCVSRKIAFNNHVKSN